MTGWERLRARLWTAILRGAQEAHDEVGRDPSEETVAVASTVLAHIDDVLARAATAQPSPSSAWFCPHQRGAAVTPAPYAEPDRVRLTTAQIAALTAVNGSGELPLTVDPATTHELHELGLVVARGDFPHYQHTLSTSGEMVAARIASWAAPDAWARVTSDDQLEELRAHRGVDARSNGWLCGVCDAVLTPTGRTGTTCSFCGRRYNSFGIPLCEVDDSCPMPLSITAAGACLAHSGHAQRLTHPEQHGRDGQRWGT